MRGAARIATPAHNVPRAKASAGIRQLQLATSYYATDHHDAYPPGAAAFNANLNRWHGARARTNDPFTPAGSPLADYLDSDAASHALRECPSFAHRASALRDDGAGFETAAGGYGYNNAFVGVVRTRDDAGLWRVSDDSNGSRADRFRRPAATLAFSDAAFLSDRLIEYSFAEPRVWPDSPGYAPDPSVHFRHTGAANIAWLDGHVASERRAQTEAGWYSQEHAGAHGLGWPGDYSDNRLFDYD